MSSFFQKEFIVRNHGIVIVQALEEFFNSLTGNWIELK